MSDSSAGPWDEGKLLASFSALSGSPDPESLLRTTLELTIGLVRARLGYAALGRTEDPSWSVLSVADPADAEATLERVSRTVRALALDEGKPILTAAADHDPRFQHGASVRTHGIKAVICVPLGAANAPGVLYVEGEPGMRFTQSHVRLVEGMARIAGQTARSLLARIADDRTDPTVPFRAKLQASSVVGRSEAVAEVLRQLAAVAPRHRVPVLLLGPSGCGKTALARVLHDSSPRAEHRFVAVDCAQLKAERAQADLFGAIRGAYTGLDKDRDGLVTEADGGTLFLDEVGELPPEVQTMLLTFLDSQEYRRMGEPRTRKADVRLVAATSRSPSVLIEPLFHRLSQWEIRVPALNQRRADIPALARALVARFARREGLDLLELSEEAIDGLVHRDWPGNVRELDNVVVRAVLWALADGDNVIRRSHVTRPEEPAQAWPSLLTENEEEATRRFQHAHAAQVLARCGGNKTEAANRLGISRDTLYKRLRSE